MPIKKHKTHHRVHHEHHKRSKKFLKVYAPYIPLLLVIGLSIFLSSGSEFRRQKDNSVLSYATSISSQELLDATNRQREKAGDGDLALNGKLSEAAQSKARDMSSKDYWSHTSPDGHEPWYFIEKAGYTYSKAAENLAYGFDSSNSTISGWMNSPEHRANLLDDSLNEVGFGIANITDYQGSGPQTLVVAMYASGAKTGISRGAKSDGQPTAVLADDQTKISLVQSLSGGKAPWSGFLVGLLLGISIMYLLIKHLRTLRRALLSGEKFVVKHPLWDATLVALAVLALILSRTSGVIQ